MDDVRPEKCAVDDPLALDHNSSDHNNNNTLASVEFETHTVSMAGSRIPSMWTETVNLVSRNKTFCKDLIQLT